MTDEIRNSEQHDSQKDDAPQVFAVSKTPGEEWRFSRRDFVKAAGTAGAVGIAAGTLAGSQHDVARAESPRQSIEGAKAHKSRINSIAISPDGKLLVSGCNNNTLFPEEVKLKIWGLPEGELRYGLAEVDTNVNDVAIGPDSRLVAFAGHNSLVGLYSVDDQSYKPLIEHSGVVASISISPDGTMMASGSEDRLAIIWALPEGEPLWYLEGHTGMITATAFSPDNTLLATADSDNALLLWSLLNDDPPLEIDHGAWIDDVAFTPDGSRIVTSGWDGAIKIWSLPDGELLNTLTPNMPGRTYSIAIKPDGDLLVSGHGGDNTIRFWSLPDGELLQTLTGHDDNVRSVAISPDGTLVASASDDRTIKLWSLPGGEFLRDLIDISVSDDTFEGIQYSPDDSGAGVITLPAGSELPAGVTCICNTVQGAGCSCVGHRGGSGGHYWYPN